VRGETRETVCRIMGEWQSKGLISGYEEIKEGRSYVGIIFEVDVVGVLEEKSN
jgi:hypothetical protein